MSKTILHPIAGAEIAQSVERAIKIKKLLAADFFDVDDIYVRFNGINVKIDDHHNTLICDEYFKKLHAKARRRKNE